VVIAMTNMHARPNVRKMRRALVAALLVCGSAAAWGATKGPDGGGYMATDEIVYSFVDISGASGGASLLAGTDDGTAAVTLPFPFQFYGQMYSVGCVSTNGALYFVPSADRCTGFDIDFANTDITAAPVPNDRPALLPFWTDLTFDAPGAGAILYQVIGTAPNRRFVVQWHNAIPQGSGTAVTFQALLFEGGSRVVYQYKNVALTGGDPSRNGGRATVGIRNAGAPANGQQLGWSFNAPVIADGTAIDYSASDTTGPIVTATVTPAFIWPPNGKTVVVRVEGTISDSGSGIQPGSARFAVTDEYGLVQPTGAVTVSGTGTYSVGVPLVAARNGYDSDGRKYTILILASDTAGNERSTSVVVIVPHDKGK
jgi:hypothetical protein